MNYIILDMEWNQPLYQKMTVTEPVVLHAEIVQIGAVKLDGKFRVTDTFNTLISPKYYKKMHKKVQSLTRITTEQLENGLTFPEAFDAFIDWCGDEFAFLTWGPDDIPVLRDNMILHGYNTDGLPKHYNLQKIFDAQITKEHRQVALGRALETLDEEGADAHNAMNDAMNTAIVCKHLDMRTGIENYDSLGDQFRSVNEDTSENMEKTYSTRKEAMRDAEVTEFDCPVCKSLTICHDFARQNSAKSLALADCRNGHEFFVRFKFNRHSDGKLRVKRAISPLDNEKREYYKKKKEAERRDKKKRVAV